MNDSSVMWFRRDLRLRDHPALAHAIGPAAGGRSVVPLFVIDPRIWDHCGEVRRSALAHALKGLDDALRARGGALVVRHGLPDEVVPRVADEVGASEVVVTEDFGPLGRRRDAAVAAHLSAAGRTLTAVGSPYVHAPGYVRKPDGSAYRVFTPFFRQWSTLAAPPPTPLPREDTDWISLDHDGVPPGTNPASTWLPITEAEASARWASFLDHVDGYAEARDRPDLDATSGLSAALKWGAVHPRTLLAEVGSGRGRDAFVRELAFREFYADVLFHLPASNWWPLREELGAIAIDTGDDAEARFHAWTQGATGFPLVDAGMRQLLAEGWMHNRVRMVAASFLVKDLHLPWQRGARWFLDHLVDGDVANNQHGWQWVAGTGTDAAPYFRIFNPITQALKFDPNGDYVRRYVPELRGIVDSGVHEPWKQPLLAQDYPSPIVDHATEREESLRRLGAVSGTGGTRR